MNVQMRREARRELAANDDTFCPVAKIVVVPDPLVHLHPILHRKEFGAVHAMKRPRRCSLPDACSKCRATAAMRSPFMKDVVSVLSARDNDINRWRPAAFSSDNPTSLSRCVSDTLLAFPRPRFPPHAPRTTGHHDGLTDDSPDSLRCPEALSSSAVTSRFSSGVVHSLLSSRSAWSVPPLLHSCATAAQVHSVLIAATACRCEKDVWRRNFPFVSPLAVSHSAASPTATAATTAKGTQETIADLDKWSRNSASDCCLLRKVVTERYDHAFRGLDDEEMAVGTYSALNSNLSTLSEEEARRSSAEDDDNTPEESTRAPQRRNSVMFSDQLMSMHFSPDHAPSIYCPQKAQRLSLHCSRRRNSLVSRRPRSRGFDWNVSFSPQRSPWATGSQSFSLTNWGRSASASWNFAPGMSPPPTESCIYYPSCDLPATPPKYRSTEQL